MNEIRVSLKGHLRDRKTLCAPNGRELSVNLGNLKFEGVGRDVVLIGELIFDASNGVSLNVEVAKIIL